MVTMVTKQTIFDQFYETFKDEPVPHKKFTFLRQGSYEIPGGSARPPPGVRCSTKTLGIRRVKKFDAQKSRPNRIFLTAGVQ